MPHCEWPRVFVNGGLGRRGRTNYIVDFPPGTDAKTLKALIAEAEGYEDICVRTVDGADIEDITGCVGERLDNATLEVERMEKGITITRQPVSCL